MGHYLESSSEMSLHRSLKGNVAQIVSHKMSHKMSTRMSHRLSHNLLRVLGDLLFNIEMNGCRTCDLKVVAVWLCNAYISICENEMVRGAAALKGPMT